MSKGEIQCVVSGRVLRPSIPGHWAYWCQGGRGCTLNIVFQQGG